MAFPRASAAAVALPKTLRPAYIVLAPVPAYLKAIERAGAACLEQTPEISALRRSWSFLRMGLRG